MADVIGVFWMFHKRRVELGNIPFSLIIGSHVDNHIGSFNPNRDVPQESLNLVKKNMGSSVRVIDFYSNAVALSLSTSLAQYLSRVYDSHDDFSDVLPVSDSLNVFFSPVARRYVRELIQSVEQKGRSISRVFLRGDFNIFSVVSAGATTGAEVVSQLKSLLAEQFDPKHALMIAKVELSKIEDARGGIGLTRKAPNLYMGKPKYDLISDSGLNREKLNLLGYGKAIGCPASLVLSSEAEAFLKTLGFHPPRTMLADFSQLLVHDFDNTIGSWYQTLTEDEKRRYIHAEDIPILSGELRQKISREEELLFNRGKERR